MGAARYHFGKVRAGDTMTVDTADERRRVLNAFNSWKQHRPLAAGFKATSKQTDAGYLITFSGQHPNEALTAQNAAAHGSDDI